MSTSDGTRPEGSEETPLVPLPVDGDMKVVFARERRAHPEDPAAQARVWSRLESSLGMGPRDPSGGGGGGATAPATSLPRAAPKPTKIFAHLAMAACFIGGSGLLWSALSKREVPRARVVAAPEARQDSFSDPHTEHGEHAERGEHVVAALEVSSPSLESVASVAVDALPAAKDPAPPKPRENVRVSSSAREARPPETLAPCTICDERAILDVARRGLREKQYEAALAAVGNHESRFAKGQLAEERESLRVHVLVAMGRRDDADVRKAEFHRVFPESPLLESVERAGNR